MSHRSTTTASAGHDVSGARRRLGLPAVLGILLGVAALIYVLDQVSKNWAESSLPLLDPQPFLGEILQLTLLYNSGAAWGMGSEITPVVTTVQILIAIGVVIFCLRSVRTVSWAASLALVLGGALGNIHDRLLRPPGFFRGHVVDFLQLPNWPVFNVADMAVVAGAILIVLLSLLGGPTDPAAESQEDSTERTATERTAPEDTMTEGTASAESGGGSRMGSESPAASADPEGEAEPRTERA